MNEPLWRLSEKRRNSANLIPFMKQAGERWDEAYAPGKLSNLQAVNLLALLCCRRFFRARFIVFGAAREDGKAGEGKCCGDPDIETVVFIIQ